MFPYLVLSLTKFFLGRLATLPYGLDSNVTQLLVILLTKPSVFYYFVLIVSCNLVAKIIINPTKYRMFSNKQNNTNSPLMSDDVPS